MALTLDGMPQSHDLRCHADGPDRRLSLAFELCRACGLLQIVEPVPPDVLYSDADTYVTGFQKPRHIDDLLATTLGRQDPGPAIDIGCNDGALLSALARYGYGPISGVEPNAAAAGAARRAGFEVHQAFLTRDLAGALAERNGGFATAFARHVIEHVDDLDGFFAAVRVLLRDDGVFVVELPDVEIGLLSGSPSILWEEHVSYFTRELAEHVFRRYGFDLLERRTYAFGGSSVAYILRKTDVPEHPPAPPLSQALAIGRGFAPRFEAYRDMLRRLVETARRKGVKTMIYGAGPRSSVALGACGLGDAVDLAIDDRNDIRGRIMPATIQPIRSFYDAQEELSRGNILCLLGVGAENEYKVKQRLENHLPSPPMCVSLFPPRDAVASMATALDRLASL
jgi:SAM-dependent methyltransferase